MTKKSNFAICISLVLILISLGITAFAKISKRQLEYQTFSKIMETRKLNELLMHKKVALASYLKWDDIEKRLKKDPSFKPIDESQIIYLSQYLKEKNNSNSF